MEEPEDNSSKKALSGEDTFEGIFNTDDFESLIRDTMKDMFRQERRKRKLRQGAETEALVQTCSEFMNSFVIMGYNTRNEPIEPVYYCRNDMEADALSHYLQRFFMQNMLSDRRDGNDPRP